MISAAALLLVGLTALGQADGDAKAIQGTWKVVALIEDGKSLTASDIRREYLADGLLVVSGNTVSILPPGRIERSLLVFTLDTKASPRGIDLAGAKKVSSRGIYTLSGDSLVLCIGTSKADGRPTEFTAPQGSGHVMMALQRSTAVAVKPVDPKPAPPKAPPAVSWDEQIRRGLVGTWGHSTDSTKTFVTFNPDGTLSGTIEHTRGIRRVFDARTRSSGTYRVSDGVVIVTITSSTDSNRRGQVYSYRITRIGESDLIAVDQNGATRREWRVR